MGWAGVGGEEGGEVEVGDGVEGSDLVGLLLGLPRRITYRSEPLRRESLVRAAIVGRVLSDLFLVMRMCCGLGGSGAGFLEYCSF